MSCVEMTPGSGTREEVFGIAELCGFDQKQPILPHFCPFLTLIRPISTLNVLPDVAKYRCIAVGNYIAEDVSPPCPSRSSYGRGNPVVLLLSRQSFLTIIGKLRTVQTSYEP